LLQIGYNLFVFIQIDHRRPRMVGYIHSEPRCECLSGDLQTLYNPGLYHVIHTDTKATLWLAH